MESSKNVFITGVNGFIGSHIAQCFSNYGYNLYGLVRNKNKTLRLEGIDIKLTEGDITMPETLDRSFQETQFDIVVHNAGLASDWGSLDTFRTVNVEGTKNIAKKAKEAGVKRFVHISSTAIHGFNGTQPITEDSEIDPPNAYALSKVEAERWLFDNPDFNEMEITAIRPGNVFGPKDNTFIDKYLDLLVKGQGGYISSGKSKTCPTYVENLAEGIFLAATHPNAKGQAFIITDGLDINWREFTEALCKKLEVKNPVLSIPYFLGFGVASIMETTYSLFGIKNPPPLTRYRIKNGGRYYNFSIHKAQKMLGFEPKVEFDQAIENTVKWYKEVNQN